MLIHFLVRTLKSAQILILLWPYKHEKTPSKVAYLSSIAEISEIFNTGLAAQTVQNAKLSSTRILLMQDWVFRLGVSIYFETRYSAKYTKGQTVKIIYCFFSGENVLHMSVVAEDPTMVKYLLDQGINIHEECYGNFFCPEDQKPSRNDSLGPEHFLSFWRFGTRQHNRNFIHLQIFQPITAQLGNVDSQRDAL